VLSVSPPGPLKFLSWFKLKTSFYTPTIFSLISHKNAAHLLPLHHTPSTSIFFLTASLLNPSNSGPHLNQKQEITIIFPSPPKTPPASPSAKPTPTTSKSCKASHASHLLQYWRIICDIRFDDESEVYGAWVWTRWLRSFLLHPNLKARGVIWNEEEIAAALMTMGCEMLGVGRCWCYDI